MPSVTPFEHVAVAAADDIGRATAAATMASAASTPAVATNPSLFNMQFPPLGLPPLRRRSSHPVCRTLESGLDSSLFRQVHIGRLSAREVLHLSLIHISEPTRRTPISYAV